MIDYNTHRQVVNIPYYEDNTRISNSNIGWFLNKGPTYLHNMLTGKAEGDTGYQLVRGTMIHEFLLQPLEFNNDYVVFSGERPASDKQEMFCTELINSTEIEPNKTVLSAYKKVYSINGKTEDKMLSEGLKIASTLKDYINLKKVDRRTMIKPYQVTELMNISDNIHNHKMANKLLKNEYVKDGDELFHEFHINWEYNGLNCKSLLDSVHFNFKEKKCTIMDLKTTVHIHNFSTSMNTYDYLRQLCYYTMATKWYLEHERNEDVSKWSFDWYIIAIDTTGTQEIRCFRFTEEQILSRVDKIDKAITDITWHIKNKKWSYTRDYYEGDGAEILEDLD